MKYIKCRWLLAMIMSCSLFSCTNLDEEVFDRVDAGIYYQDETSVQGAVAAIYSKAAYSYLEYFWYLQEFSADQVAWRSWNGGLWGWDEALTFGETAGSGLLQLMLTGSILSKVEVGTPSVTIAVARNQMM